MVVVVGILHKNFPPLPFPNLSCSSLFSAKNSKPSSFVSSVTFESKLHQNIWEIENSSHTEAPTITKTAVDTHINDEKEVIDNFGPSSSSAAHEK